MAKCTGVRCPMQQGYNVEECNRTDCPYRTEPITNADRIRAMSDEELAEFMKHKGRCPDETKHRGCVLSCGECWLEWVKQPAEDANPFHYEKGCQPHGAEQFAKACAVCVNIGSDLCRDCKAEKKSGFEPPF